MALKKIIKFNFYQQVRFLLRKFRDEGVSDEKILNEKIKFKSVLSLDAPDGEIDNIFENPKTGLIEVTSWYDGLTGAMGALPVAYCEWLIERQMRYGDSSARDFFDIFGHRLFCLTYLAWKKNNLCARAESEKHLPLRTPILSICGLLNNAHVDSQSKYPSLFGMPVRSMINLELWLSQLFKVKVEIKPFTGGWRPVPDNECCILGNTLIPLANAPMIGRVRVERHSHFDIILGPMSPKESLRFLPSCSTWKDIWYCVRDYVGLVMEFSISLVISSSGIAPTHLGRCILGLSLCLGSNRETDLYQVRLPSPNLN